METKEPMPFYLAAGRCKRSFTCLTLKWACYLAILKSSVPCICLFFLRVNWNQLDWVKWRVFHKVCHIFLVIGDPDVQVQVDALLGVVKSQQFLEKLLDERRGLLDENGQHNLRSLNLWNIRIKGYIISYMYKLSISLRAKSYHNTTWIMVFNGMVFKSN